jgi:type IV fimbrial biogenesis protein FimT
MTTRPSRQRGITLIEAATVLAIAGVLAGVAAPSFDAARQRHHLQGAAALFETDVHFARASAVALGQPVRLDFQAEAGRACYVLHTGPRGACNCLGEQPVCESSTALRSVRYTPAQPFVLTSNSGSMVFDDVAGTVTPTATVRFTATNGDALHQVVNVMGRVRSCSPTLAGVPRC